MHEILRVLGQWPMMRRGVVVERVRSASSFSGAAVWRVEAEGHVFALRRWQENLSADRVKWIHQYQTRVAEVVPPVVPRLQIAANGSTAVSKGERLWELATWMPGVANYRTEPSAARLDAAMRTLASIHRAWEFEPELPWVEFHESVFKEMNSLNLSELRRGSLSLKTRFRRLHRIEKELPNMAQRSSVEYLADEKRLANEVICLLTAVVPRLRVKAEYWKDVELPLQRRLGDIHNAHVLFTGDEVTGVIDFGAADFDSPAGDVARLLGSMVGDDRERWAQGLASYRAVHPLTSDEVAAVDFFDTSGTAISAANWISWLWPESTSAPQFDRPAALNRLRELVARLQSLSRRVE